MKKIIIFFFCVCISISQSYAMNPQVEDIYTSFLIKINTNYSISQKQQILEKIHVAAQEYYWAESENRKKEIFSDLQKLNNEELYKLWEENNISNFKENQIESEQKQSLERVLISVKENSLTQELTQNNVIEFIKTTSQRETIRNNDIYKLEYSLYFPVNTNSLSQLKKKQGIVILENNEYRFIEDYSYTKKIPYSEIGDYGYKYLTDDKKFTQENNVFYAYNFTKFRYFDDSYGIYESQLLSGSLANSQALVYKDENGKYNFITEFTKTQIAPVSRLYGISDKHLFLQNIGDDLRYESTNISNTISQMRDLGESLLSQSSSQQEYIQKVYDYILDNTQYTQNINLDNTEIFSGIETFMRNDGVCTGYTKLMAYLLYIGNIIDVEVIRGYVIDAADFPQIGHAWVRIGQSYYDPTFDDPVGAQKTKKIEEYVYYNLPRDIFYANRYEYEDLPVGLKTATENEISLHIYDKLKRLIPKYQNSLTDYAVFGPVVFREKYNISQNTIITPEILGEKIGNYIVENDSFRFLQDGKTRQITFFRYFKLDSTNTQIVLQQLQYDVEDLYLFDWELSNGQREWRLAYEIELK